MKKNYRKGAHIVGGHGTVLQKWAPYVDDVQRVYSQGDNVKISLGSIDPRCGGQIGLKLIAHPGYVEYAFKGAGKQHGQLRGDEDAIAKVLERWSKRTPGQLEIETVVEV